MTVSHGKTKNDKTKQFRKIIGNNDVVELKPLKVTFAKKKNVAKRFELSPLKSINETVNC